MELEISDRQDAVRLPEAEIRRALRTGLEMEARDAELSVALVGDEEIAELNRRFLARDGVTDVLAFSYESSEDALNGEIVVNAELAVRVAASKPHGPEDELLLYIVHGLLHLLGYDDHDPDDTHRMRAREQDILTAVGRTVEF